MKKCQYCNNTIPDEAVVCTLCGRQVQLLSAMPPQNINRVEKWIAFVLCFFFGYLGVHKFYEGRIGLGILWLLTLGLLGIGWFVDCIVILTKPDPYYVYRG